MLIRHQSQRGFGATADTEVFGGGRFVFQPKEPSLVAVITNSFASKFQVRRGTHPFIILLFFQPSGFFSMGSKPPGICQMAHWSEPVKPEVCDGQPSQKKNSSG